jgi:hypothetical protein
MAVIVQAFQAVDTPGIVFTVLKDVAAREVIQPEIAGSLNIPVQPVGCLYLCGLTACGYLQGPRSFPLHEQVARGQADGSQDTFRGASCAASNHYAIGAVGRLYAHARGAIFMGRAAQAPARAAFPRSLSRGGGENVRDLLG